MEPVKLQPEFFRHRTGDTPLEAAPRLPVKGYAKTLRGIHCNWLSFIIDSDERAAAFKRVQEMADEVRAEIKQERLLKEGA